ncbi:hypothetical protein IMCC1989_2337 [gamma proteobacterium IMCC1989]|nr:hypothetical protein IMCC1989_2337 [gamma proteobacterium IMCC1989]
MDKLPSSLFDALEGEDDLGVVIRSHVIIEQYLNQLISSLVISNKHFKKNQTRL